MTEAPAKMYCANHPDVETTLRCNKCEKPICARCAVLTPTGYRCKECIRGQQKIFNTATWVDYPLVMAVVGILAFLGSLIAYRIGFLVILLAPLAGGVIAEIARAITRRHRSRQLFIMAALAAVVGCLPVGVQFIFRLNLFGLLWQAAYAILMTSTFYARLAGIRIG